MLKILFAILKLFPQGLALIQQYNAAENTKLGKQFEEYRVRSLRDAASIERLQRVAETYRQLSETYLENSNALLRKIDERDTEIERLKNETQQRLKAVAAMDSESVFNASLSGAKPATIVSGSTPVTKRESTPELRWNRS